MIEDSDAWKEMAENLTGDIEKIRDDIDGMQSDIKDAKQGEKEAKEASDDARINAIGAKNIADKAQKQLKIQSLK